jgi:hypothetical protein
MSPLPRCSWTRRRWPGRERRVRSSALRRSLRFQGSVTSDQAAEASLADIDTAQLPAIVQKDTIAAVSLTTPGGSGF